MFPPGFFSCPNLLELSKCSQQPGARTVSRWPQCWAHHSPDPQGPGREDRHRETETDTKAKAHRGRGSPPGNFKKRDEQGITATERHGGPQEVPSHHSGEPGWAGSWPETTGSLFSGQNRTEARATAHWGPQSLGRKSDLPGVALGRTTDLALCPSTHTPLPYMSKALFEKQLF